MSDVLSPPPGRWSVLARPKAWFPKPLRQGLRLVVLGCAALGLVLATNSATQDAVANGDTRTISIQHMHTKELTTVTFKRDGRYDGAALTKLNWALRDWRLDEPTKIDPRLFDVAWEVHRSVGSREAFHVVSAYRSPQTNSMLRNRSRGVAKHSQHMLGKAMDFYLPDISPPRVREVGMRLQRGGVGYYPTAHTPFIHLDVGSVRSWPRMSRDQLVRLFPDGRTVHLPSSGGAMEGYEIAKADIIARGGSVAGFGGGEVDEGEIMQGSRRSLWASLFGGDDEEDARPTRGRRASIAPRRAPNPSLMAYASGNSEDGGSRFGFTPQPQPDVETGSDVMRERSNRIRPSRGQIAPATQVASAPPPPSQVEAKSEVASPAKPMPVPEPLAPRLTTVMAPIPLARPRSLAVSADPAATAQGEGFALASLPGPASDAPPRLMSAPVPPARPGALTAAAPTPVPAAAEPEMATGTTAPVLVTLKHPAPPERPKLDIAGLQATAIPKTTASVAVPATEKEALKTLFNSAATPASPPRNVKVATAKAKATGAEAAGWASAATPAASLGFSRSAPTDTKTGKFSGPAVRSLPTTFVQP